MARLTGALKVSGGRFSFPWYVDDWNTDAMHAKPVKVGRVDGVVDASGTATSTAVFTEPVLASTQVRTVKVKRTLDAIKGVAIAFARQGADRVVTLRVDIAGDGQCKAAWAIVKPSPPPRVAGGRRRAEPPADAPHPGTPAPSEPAEQKDPCEGLPSYKENGTYRAGNVVRADVYYAGKWRRYTCGYPGSGDTCPSDFREPIVGRGWEEGPLCKYSGHTYY
jgi:hypothetical protein